MTPAFEIAMDAELTAIQDAAFRLSSLERDWRKWLPAMLPGTFTRGFAPHHARFWEWLWSVKRDVRPRPYVLPLPRHGGKSSSVEAGVMAIGARKVRDYGFYVSATQPQADDHLTSIEPKLGAEAVKLYYPDLSERHVGLHGAGTHWRRQRLWTKRGLIIDALGIDTASRGKKLGDQRPSFIIFDDIDDKDESPTARQKKMETMKSDIIGARSHDCMIIFIQNKIHRDSIMSQIIDGRADMLTDAIIEQPLPALENFKYETRSVSDESGYTRQQHVILSGDRIWEGQDIEACQGQLNDMGLDSFLREVQQDVERAVTGALLSMFEEQYSVIGWSEFQLLYGQAATDQNGEPKIPSVGYLGNYQDTGSTKEHPNTSLWLWRPELGMPLSDSVFVYRELTLPEYPEPVTLNPSPLTVACAIHRLETPWGEGTNPTRMRRQISHERPDWANFYNIDLPKVRDEVTGLPMKALRFSQWSPVKSGGLGTLQAYMTVIERDHSPVCPHKDPKTLQCSDWMHVEGCPHRETNLRQQRCWAKRNPFQTRSHLWGRSRFVLVAADNQAVLEANGRQKQPYDAAGLVRLRAEIPRYTEDKLKGGPAKVFDDAIDCALKASEVFFVPTSKPRKEDQIEAALPEAYRKDAPQEVIAGLSDLARQNLNANTYYARHNATAQVEEQRKAGTATGYYAKLRQRDRR